MLITRSQSTEPQGCGCLWSGYPLICLQLALVARLRPLACCLFATAGKCLLPPECCPMAHGASKIGSLVKWEKRIPSSNSAASQQNLGKDKQWQVICHLPQHDSFKQIVSGAICQLLSAEFISEQTHMKLQRLHPISVACLEMRFVYVLHLHPTFQSQTYQIGLQTF